MENTNYPYTGALMLDTAKPYSFAEYGGIDFLDAYAHSRQEARARCHKLSWRDARKNGQRAATLRVTCNDLYAQLERDGCLDTTAALSRILTAAGSGEVEYSEQIDIDAHARRFLDRLLRRYEAFGRVFDRYDRSWRKASALANTPQLLANLAAAAAWLAEGLREDDPPAALAYCNVLLKLNDRLSAGLFHEFWDLDAQSSHHASLALEAEHRLLREYRRAGAMA